MKKDERAVKKSTSLVVLIYALALIFMGYWGYMKAGSIASLVTGTIFGALLIISSILMFFNLTFGRHSALGLTILLTLTFSIRYSITQKSIPAILSVFSAAMLLFLIARTVNWKR